VTEAGFFPGTYYLEKVDEKFRRTYGRVAFWKQNKSDGCWNEWIVLDAIFFVV
jgi:hypothetical protein